jgi:hypothetical protein
MLASGAGGENLKEKWEHYEQLFGKGMERCRVAIDKDGDGVADAEEAAAQESAGEQGEDRKNLSPEEAERYLQALQEGRPQRQEPARRGGQRRVEKDW